MNYCAYIAYNLKDDDFEDLSNSIAERLTGNEMISYAPGKDGGKDGRRIGFSKNIDKWKKSGSKFIIQAKHTKEYDASCSRNSFYKNKTSTISEEIERINQRISSYELEYYALFTNRKYTGHIDLIIRKKISDETGLDIDNIEIFGIETINRLLNLESNHDLVAQYNLHPNPGELSLPKNVLTKQDKAFLLDNIVLKNEIYIKRHFVQSNDENNNYHHGQTIEKIVSEEQFICILGNPGTGKTTTLKKIALDYWKDGEQTSFTPIYKSLKNFTINNTIENFIPNKYKKLNKIIFIFDGLDEISDIEHFKSELQNFTNRYRSENYKNSIKFIISCRTNIYNKTVNNITDYKTYHLQDLKQNESIEILTALCQTKDITTFAFNNKHNDFIKTPLQTEILASYINEHDKLSDNIGLLWEDYINQRFKIDKTEKLTKRPFNKLLIERESKKISIINELMNTLLINENTLLSLFNYDYNILEQFIENPLLNKNLSNNTYSFENRNIQEYFAAKLLTNLTFEEIVPIIKVNDLNVTHPNLLNTLSFLIDLTDNEKSKKLIEWLYLNESSLLFDIDSIRISPEHRITVFQNYFKQTCIEKHFWIGNSTETVKIAQFGNCEENFLYLIDIIKKEHFHFRVTQSAISLLSFFSIQGKEPEIITLFLDILKNKEIINGIKSEILQCIRELKLTVFDRQLLDKIIEILKENDEKPICKTILDLINISNNIDKYFSFIKDELFRIHEITQRKSRDETHYGTEYIIEKIALKLIDPNLFVEFSSLLISLENNYSNKISPEFKRKIIEVIKLDKSLIVLFYNSIIEEKYLDFYESTFKQIVIESNSVVEICSYLIEHDKKDKIYYISIFINNEEHLNSVFKLLLKENIPNENYEILRNWLSSYQSTEIVIKLDELCKKNNIYFKQPTKTKEDVNLHNDKAQQFIQDNFDVLFDNNKLKKEITKIFSKFNNTITTDDYKLLHKNWWKNNEHFSTQVRSNVYAIIHHILYWETNGNKIDFLEVEKLINSNDTLLIREIISSIKSNDRAYKFIINENQNKYLQTWSGKTCETLNFSEILIFNDDTSYSYHPSGNHYKLESLLFLKEHIDIKLNKDFLLKSISLYKISDSSDENKLSTIKKWINDDTAFNQQIIYDLKNKSLTNTSESRHIEYAIKNNLTELSHIIKLYFIQKDYIHIKIFKEYITNFNLVYTLKEYCFDINSMLFWSSIELMLELVKELPFCTENALIYLENKETNYMQNALNVLFITKHKSAIIYFIHFLNNKKFDDRELMISTNNYYVIQDDDTIIELYKLIYLGTNIDRYDRHTYQNLMTSFVNNSSKINYNLIQSQLEKVRQTIANTEDDLFYINQLIDSSRESYISSLSKPMSLDKALELVKTINS